MIVVVCCALAVKLSAMPENPLHLLINDLIGHW